MRVGLLLVVCAAAHAQVDTGELRLDVRDPAGLALPASGTLASEVSQTRRTYQTDVQGRFVFQHLPLGLYRVTAAHSGFTSSSNLVEIRSSVPVELHVVLKIQPASTAVVVTDAATLLDPHSTGVTYGVGAGQIHEEQSAIPGRGLMDLVNLQPGWLFEGNGVLHPRGSENQTLFVLDGVPMEENRAPGFAPDMETGPVESMSVLTGDYPAEYGRKLGGVVEVTTSRDVQPGWHGSAQAEGGSFGEATGFLSAVYGWKRSAVTVSASGDHSDHYLDPPALGNYTNTGTLGGAAAIYDQDLSNADRIHLSVQRTQAAFEVPNENLQEAAGQRQDRTTREDLGQAAWTHEFSPQLLLSMRASVEDLSANLRSNLLATPVIAAQQRGFRRGYFNGTLAMHEGRHDLKAGADAFYSPVTEALQYQITDASYFDDGTPLHFNFFDRRLDREQAAFAQDAVRLGNLTLSAGLRFDHYSLAVNDQAVSPRLGAAWYWPKAGMVLRFSYDRVFITPAMENLLLASSPAVDTINPLVLRIPLRPSRGNYFETGFSKALSGAARLDASFYRRTFVNYADDDVFLNTGISFPIAFASAWIRGEDVKLSLPHWGRFAGFLSYSNMIGIAQLPVAGGLFLGDDASGVVGVTGAFPISQDQRNTARARLRYQVHPRLWVAAVAGYGSGLPVEISGDADLAALAAQYGRQIIDRVNFSAGRVRPNFSLDASTGAELWRREKRTLRLEATIENLTGRLNVINFAGLFSGTAVAAPRSGSARLEYDF